MEKGQLDSFHEGLKRIDIEVVLARCSPWPLSLVSVQKRNNSTWSNLALALSGIR